MISRPLYRSLSALIVTTCMVITSTSPASAESESVAGLLATYSDKDHRASESVVLPELGLADNESPHPAIAPSFTVIYQGSLLITTDDLYEFTTIGDLTLNGKSVKSPTRLTAGSHALRLSYTHADGPLRMELSWKSGHFIQEPIPPSAFTHQASPSDLLTDDALKHEYPAPSTRMRKAFISLKCLSCHDDAFLATMHHKHTAAQLPRIIRHAPPHKKWVEKDNGPVLKDTDTMKQLTKDLLKLPFPQAHKPSADTQIKDGVKMVSTTGGLACVACHGIRDHAPSAESIGPNLSVIGKRVSYDWFARWMSNPARLKPGVPMPAFFAAHSPTDRKHSIDTLWNYMSRGKDMPMPKELTTKPKAFVLSPKDAPIVQRAYLRLPDERELLRAICVGLPNGVSYCFDAETCQIVYIWAGGFLDMAPHWKDKSNYPVGIAGESFYLADRHEGLGVAGQKPLFKGYELIDGNPKFEFVIGQTSVELLLEAPSPDKVIKTFTIGQHAAGLSYMGPSTKKTITLTASTGKWEKNTLILLPAKSTQLSLTMERTK